MAIKHLLVLTVLAVLVGCISAAPGPRPRARARSRQPLQARNTVASNTVPNPSPRNDAAIQPLQARNTVGYPSSRKDAALPPVVNNFLRNGVPSGAQLINMQPILPAISARLPDNYTLIRPNVVDTFRCSGAEFPEGYRKYGYYADTDNECQIFHVCLPMKQLYPGNFTNPITYQFSFICPEYTIFSQDVMVCAWANEAVPCEYAQELYSQNDYFFSNKGLDGETYGNKVEIRNKRNVQFGLAEEGGPQKGVVELESQ